jgi:NAD-dependent DNA ligase
MTRTASEVAEEILKISKHWYAVDVIPEIAQILATFREDGAVEIANATISEACKEARAEALEEAAKACICRDDCERIRALKAKL